MAITLRSSSSVAYGTRTNTTVNRPTGATTDDLIVVAMDCGGSTLVQPSGPSGWTLLGRVTYSAPDPWAVDLALWAKPHDGAASWTWTHTSRSTQAYAVALTGVDLANFLDVVAETTLQPAGAGGSLTATAAALDVITDGAWSVLLRGSWDGNAITPPTGWTERYDQPVLWVGTREWPTAGDTGTVPIPSGNGSGSSPWATIHAAIRPAGAGGESTTGTGAASAQPATASGAGSVRATGSGAASAPAATASGSGTTTAPSTTGSGSATGPAATATGSGTAKVGGTGDASVPGGSATGSGTASTTGTGSSTATPGAASGTGQVRTTGSGSATAPAAMASGTSATPTATGPGSATAPAGVAAGSGSMSTSGSGSATSATGTADGDGTVTTTGEGSAVAPTGTADGSAGVIDPDQLPVVEVGTMRPARFTAAPAMVAPTVTADAPRFLSGTPLPPRYTRRT